MKTASEYACEVESEYMAGVRANLAEAGGTLLGGSRFEREEHDSAEAVRAAMVDRRIYDRERYGRMPHGYGFTMRGLDRRWLFGKRVKSVTIASVLAPPGPLLETDEPAPPVTMSELMRHVESLKTKNLFGILFFRVAARTQVYWLSQMLLSAQYANICLGLGAD